ncbi:MAG: hypothetical protein Q4B40_04920 [Clostridia bacterium]|nr:hypothetical protein [Clostridia bacterium]
MKNNISVKRIVCFLLALFMLFTVVGCKEKKKKKKVIIRNNVIVNEDYDFTTDFNASAPIIDSVVERSKRQLLKAEKEEEVIPYDTIHKETFTPEFEYKNVAFSGNLADYVIVYSVDKDKNGAATNARVLAEKLATFFKDNDNVTIPVKKETEVSGNEKMIIVGDTIYHKSSLSETKFAVKLDGDNIIFEGGHQVMVEKAVDWFRTVKRENGKIATLTGETDEFTSTITLDGKKYVYVWGDEFDGEELVDKSKWKVGNHMPQWADLEYIATKDVCYVENGRLRMTGIRYLSEKSGDIGWATCGSYDTEQSMAYRNGYLEFDAKISYTKGVLMPLWTMSNPEVGLQIPREQFEVAWSIEFDIFETFANGNQWDVSIHKYYKDSGSGYNNKIELLDKDKDGNDAKITMYDGVDISDKFTDQERYKKGWAKWGFITSLRNFYDSEENAKQMYKFEGDALKKLNDTYHKYGFLYTKEGYKMYIDGECWLERKWDPAFDGVDCNNNNGWGYNMYYYLIMNQHLYTPASESSGFDVELHVDNRDLPISSFLDNVRLYQLPDSIEVETPALRN